MRNQTATGILIERVELNLSENYMGQEKNSLQVVFVGEAVELKRIGRFLTEEMEKNPHRIRLTLEISDE